MKQQFIVSGMSCAACQAAVERSVRRLEGVESVSVNLLTNKMAVSYDPGHLSVDVIIGAVEDAGYGAESIGMSGEGAEAAHAALSRSAAKGTSCASTSHDAPCTSNAHATPCMSTSNEASCAATSSEASCASSFDGAPCLSTAGAAVATAMAFPNTESSGHSSSRFSRQKSSTSHVQDARRRWSQSHERDAEQMKRRLIVSVVVLVPLMWIAMGPMIGLPMPGFFTGRENAVGYVLTQLLLAAVILILQRNFFISGFKGLFHRAPNMNSLIAIGSAASFLFGAFALARIGYGLGTQNDALVDHYLHQLYFESSAMILVLVSVGKTIESRATAKTSEAMDALFDLVPRTAPVIRDGQRVEIDTEDLMPGDVVLLLPGARVPCDGVVLEGASAVDESSMTGESMPVEKAPGDSLMAGTINGTGSMLFKATRTGDDTTLSQMIALMEEASSSKAPVARLADRVSGVFVPAVMGIALVTLLAWLFSGASVEHALNMAISVLVISCPCALGLATPVAIMVATGVGMKQGILIKSGDALETAGNIQTVVLDKTGTLTTGHPAVTDIVAGEGVDQKTLLRLAALLESRSEHPLAAAVLDAARQQAVEVPDDLLSGVEAVPGLGVTGTLKDGRSVAVGNARLMDVLHWHDPDVEARAESFENQGSTLLFVVAENRMLGFMAVQDPLKKGSAGAVQRFRDLGIHVVMLTGDRKASADAIGRQLGGIDAVAEVLPTEKVATVRRLRETGDRNSKKENRVAMVGDGVNDAPALAAADVGMAIGAGSDIAIDSADIVLVRNDLNDAVNAVELSRKTLRVIRQNLFWALFYNVIAIPVAAGAFYTSFGLQLTPMIAALAMSLSSLFVVFNALRLRRFVGVQAPAEDAADPSGR